MHLIEYAYNAFINYFILVVSMLVCINELSSVVQSDNSAVGHSQNGYDNIP